MKASKLKIVFPSLISQLLFVVGVVIVLVSMVFMIANLDDSERYLTRWIVSVVAGMAFIIMSIVLSYVKTKEK